MFSEINRIKNVGKFEDFDTPVELGKLTLVYAENGRGKSTLADVFRSLCTGKSDRVLGRRTHGSNNPPDLEISLKNGDSISFNSDTWVTSAGGIFETDNIFVFDDVFINENVYSGNTVDTPHRRNLASLIIGDTAVRFQEQEDVLSDSVNVRDVKIKQLESDIGKHIHPFRNNPSDKPAVSEFAGLRVIPDIDTKLEEQVVLVRQLKEMDKICKHEDFDKLPIPELPVDKLSDVLQMTLAHIEQSAERRVKKHMQQFVSEDMEDWLDNGTEIFDPNSEICPYCGQRLKPGHLIEHYQSYFNEEYKALKSRISEFSDKYLDFREQLEDLRTKLQNNSKLSGTWNEELPDIRIGELKYEQIRACLTAAIDLMSDVIVRKANAPLEILEFDAKVHEEIDNWNLMAVQIRNYNGEVALSNQEIHSLKERLRSGNLDKAERREQLLRNTKLRHCDLHVNSLCCDFLAESSELKGDKDRIRETRVEKNQAIANLFKRNKKNVNKYLGTEYFDVEFEVCQFDFTRDTLGERLEAYALKFPTGVIPIGKSDALPSDTSFKNTLSAGDRATLSFAMFLAHVDTLIDPSGKLFIIDDPITSLDANRRWSTLEAISELCDKDGQVIVLSHSPEFLHMIWEEYGSRYGRAHSTRRLLIRPSNGAVHASEIEPNWNSESFLMNRHRKRINRVEQYAGGAKDDREDVGKCLRQIIEHHYKDLYPKQYTSKLGSFGAFLGCVRQAKSGDTLKTLKDRKLDELEKANRFLRGLHHDDDAEFPEEAELRSRCKKVLAHIRSK